MTGRGVLWYGLWEAPPGRQQEQMSSCFGRHSTDADALLCALALATGPTKCLASATTIWLTHSSRAVSGCTASNLLQADVVPLAAGAADAIGCRL